MTAAPRRRERAVGVFCGGEGLGILILRHVNDFSVRSETLVQRCKSSRSLGAFVCPQKYCNQALLLSTWLDFSVG